MNPVDFADARLLHRYAVLPDADHPTVVQWCSLNSRAEWGFVQVEARARPALAWFEWRAPTLLVGFADKTDAAMFALFFPHRRYVPRPPVRGNPETLPIS